MQNGPINEDSPTNIGVLRRVDIRPLLFFTPITQVIAYLDKEFSKWLKQDEYALNTLLIILKLLGNAVGIRIRAKNTDELFKNLFKINLKYLLEFLQESTLLGQRINSLTLLGLLILNLISYFENPTKNAKNQINNIIKLIRGWSKCDSEISVRGTVKEMFCELANALEEYINTNNVDASNKIRDLLVKLWYYHF